MIFNPKTASIFDAVRAGKVFKFCWIFKWIGFGIGALLGSVFLGFGFQVLDLALIALSIGGCCWLSQNFFEKKLKKAPIDPENLASLLDYNLAKAVSKAKKVAQSQGIKKVNSSLLFYALLLQKTTQTEFIFSRATLSIKQLKKRLRKQKDSFTSGKFEGFSEDFKQTLKQGLKIAKEKEKSRIGIGEVIVALSKIEPCFKQVLIDFDLTSEDFENIGFWWDRLAERKKKFWSKQNLRQIGSLGRGFSAGFTSTLDKFSVNLPYSAGIIELVGHNQDLEKLERVLATEGVNNALLVGEAGTGKKTILRYFAQQSLFGQSLPENNFQRVVWLDLSALISQVGESGLEPVLEKIFSEAIKAGNVILAVGDFQDYVGRERKPGVVDISGVLVKFLKNPDFRMVALTTPQGFHRHLEPQTTLTNLFQKIEITEISPTQTIRILEIFALRLEKKYQKFISYPALREIVALSDRYLPSFSWPKKALDVLNESMVYLSQTAQQKVLLPKQVAKVVSQKTRIPVGEVETKERETLLNLEQLIHQRIINQDYAVQEVAEAMRRARTEITQRKRPVGVFLFLGPTGVGKTETAKALAEKYFGSEQKMIRLDMSEFQDLESIKRLIGSPGREGLLTTPVRERPFSLILLDELEKSHPDVLNLFLQVFDEGFVTDGLGRKVSFKNSVIIGTSNAGAELIFKDIQEDKELDLVREDLLRHLFEQGIFRPELVNRFDTVAIFRPLTEQNLRDIADLKLREVKAGLERKHIEFEITQDLKNKVAELGYSPEFGARAMNRVIQDRVEDPLAEALLREEIGKGDRIKMTGDFEIVKIGNR